MCRQKKVCTINKLKNQALQCADSEHIFTNIKGYYEKQNTWFLDNDKYSHHDFLEWNNRNSNILKYREKSNS